MTGTDLQFMKILPFVTPMHWLHFDFQIGTHYPVRDFVLWRENWRLLQLQLSVSMMVDLRMRNILQRKFSQQWQGNSLTVWEHYSVSSVRVLNECVACEEKNWQLSVIKDYWRNFHLPYESITICSQSDFLICVTCGSWISRIFFI